MSAWVGVLIALVVDGFAGFLLGFRVGRLESGEPWKPRREREDA